MIVKSEKPLSEAEQKALQGAAFVIASGAAFAEDHSERNWHVDEGRKLAGKEQNPQPGDTRTLSDIEQARNHGLSVLESSR